MKRAIAVDGDQILAIIADAWVKKGLLSGGGVVATVMSNLGTGAVSWKPAASN